MQIYVSRKATWRPASSSLFVFFFFFVCVFFCFFFLCVPPAPARPPPGPPPPPGPEHSLFQMTVLNGGTPLKKFSYGRVLCHKHYRCCHRINIIDRPTHTTVWFFSLTTTSFLNDTCICECDGVRFKGVGWTISHSVECSVSQSVSQSIMGFTSP